ncbi:MAG: DUF1553 domain-containing protein [Aureliella sp.]
MNSLKRPYQAKLPGSEERFPSCSIGHFWYGSSLTWLSVALIIAGPMPIAAAQDEAELDFTRDVRPILSDRCFFCHGPDSGVREADLRLDLEEFAHEYAIVPGDPDSSDVIDRIFSEDPDTVMPPPSSKIALTDEEKQILKRWVAAGAKYDAHWAFQTVERPVVPVAPDSTAESKNPIDHFVNRKLGKVGLQPNPPADRATLLRRISFDLTGLPPSFEAARKFLSDERDENDVVQLVDSLLESKHFGERMAVDWLDVARYADTHGYQNDRYRPMWPWRDWVVNAFNSNLPYDDFIRWQLAGDLLDSPTQEQILATAFNRNHRQTNEGGSVEEEFRAEYVADRVNTFGAAFLGLTLECCRCHDHKYDPISQKEYYQLAAYFNSIDESGLYSHFTESTPTPALMLTSETQQSKLEEIESQISVLESKLDELVTDKAAFERWSQSLVDIRPRSFESDAKDSVSIKDSIQLELDQHLVGDFGLDGLKEGKVADRSAIAKPGKVSDNPVFQPGRIGTGVLLSGDNNVNVPAGGTFDRMDPFSVSLWIKPAERYDRAVVYHRSRAWTDSASRGYELLIEDGRLSAALVHFWPGNAMRVQAMDEVPVGVWSQVTVTYDGSSRAKGLRIYVNGEPIDTAVVRDKLTKTIASDPKELALGQRFRDNGFKLGMMDELRVFDKSLGDLEAKYLYLSDAAPENIREYLYNLTDAGLERYFNSVSKPAEVLRSELLILRQDQAKIVEAIPEIMVMREETRQRPTFVLTRGAYDAPGEEVGRGTPAQLLPMPKKVDDRRELAEWLVDRRHPLTARVAVNRLWQSLFGTGLVATSEDFGLQGALPSHPELLDWLAAEFMESGWDMKALVRLIVLSDAYQRSSNPTAEALREDPENRWLARGPAMRLPAEMIRDTALAASGLLVDKQGGPPVKPYQPDGLWKEKSGQAYKRDSGEGSHRRSLYTYWKRTSPPPAMMTLDASNREVCVVRRQVTMTPLQMLVLLNDPQYVEAAKALATKAAMSESVLDSRLIYVFQSLVTRVPSEAELDVLQRLYHGQLEEFQRNAKNAEELLAIGDFNPSHESLAAVSKAELAALTVVAEGLMSYDETVMKR